MSLNWLLYDGHGNWVRMMAPDYTVSGFQWRGVWGEVQGSLGTGRGYCANLGHPEDETGLVYMRARYYEPATGRFISEDPARDGMNWFLYAYPNPVTWVDFSGRESLPSLIVSMSGRFTLQGGANLGVQTLRGTMYFVDDAVMIEIEMIQATRIGALKLGELLTWFRGWAAGQGIQKIFISGVPASAAGQRMFEVTLRLIQRMGDAGELIHSGPWTWIYWILQ